MFDWVAHLVIPAVAAIVGGGGTWKIVQAYYEGKIKRERQQQVHELEADRQSQAGESGKRADELSARNAEVCALQQIVEDYRTELQKERADCDRRAVEWERKAKERDGEISALRDRLTAALILTERLQGRIRHLEELAGLSGGSPK